MEKKNMSSKKLAPASKKQAMFLQSKSDITVFGGAAIYLNWSL